MNEKITQSKGALFAALAATATAATAIPAAHAQQGTTPAPAPAPAPAPQQGSQNSGTNGPTGQESANGPSSLNPGGVQGRPNGGEGANGGGSQTQGTSTGAAAQGNSATQGSIPAANQGAQGNRGGMQGNMQQRTPGSPRISVTSSNALTGIINRAQDMLRVADSRKVDAPGGAAASYRKASLHLRQMLSAAGMRTSGSNSLPPLSGSGSSAGRATAALSSFPLSSDQATEDIRLLRSMAMQSANGRRAVAGMSAADLRKLASLYATGSKEFFTGQLRDALFESPVRVSVRNTGSRVEGVASTGSGAAAERGDRPELPFRVHITPDPVPVAEGGATAMQGTEGTEGTAVAGSSALPNGGPAELGATAPNLNYGTTAPTVQYGPAPTSVLSPNPGLSVSPTVQLAPVPGYGGYFYAPPVLFQGVFPQQSVGGIRVGF